MISNEQKQPLLDHDRFRDGGVIGFGVFDVSFADATDKLSGRLLGCLVVQRSYLQQVFKIFRRLSCIARPWLVHYCVWSHRSRATQLGLHTQRRCMVTFGRCRRRWLRLHRTLSDRFDLHSLHNCTHSGHGNPIAFNVGSALPRRTRTILNLNRFSDHGADCILIDSRAARIQRILK